MTHAYHLILIMVYGSTYSPPDYDGSSGTTDDNTCISGWGTKTITWYSNDDRQQYNISNTTYYWVAIG